MGSSSSCQRNRNATNAACQSQTININTACHPLRPDFPRQEDGGEVPIGPLSSFGKTTISRSSIISCITPQKLFDTRYSFILPPPTSSYAEAMETRSRFKVWADKAAVESEPGLTSTQLMV
ncbi:hypothetical protein HZ326_10382 [Fusarium oxysporum f. sp. albedinis]|nr:hypothetical protein HZ326_10382 [Fusarium oxysporum f. sp. albedinis]